MAKSKKALDAVVKDLSLAEFGRKEIELAEHEMPGLMSVRAEFAKTKPLKGARLGIPKEFFGEGLAPEVRAVCQNAMNIAQA